MNATTNRIATDTDASYAAPADRPYPFSDCPHCGGAFDVEPTCTTKLVLCSCVQVRFYGRLYVAPVIRRTATRVLVEVTTKGGRRVEKWYSLRAARSAATLAADARQTWEVEHA